MILIPPFPKAPVFAVLSIVPISAFAGTVTWGVQMQGATDFDVFSDGTVITEPDFGYELGFFVPMFVPTPSNTSLWDANWTRVGDRSLLDLISGNYGGQVDTGSLVAAGSGSQVYVWGDNSRDPGEDLEWVLYTGDDWIAADTNDDLVWEPAGASQAIVGRISTTDPAETGGIVSRPVVLGANAIQTASVPEPGAFGLLLLSLGACALRRARPSKPAATL